MREGLPVTVLEAMALERPVIATDVGGVRDAVIPGRTGLLVGQGDVVAFAEALVELAGDTQRARAMGIEGKHRYLEAFTIDRRVEAYVRMLSELLASPSGASK